MAALATLPDLFTSLSDSLSSAREAASKASIMSSIPHGLSLLDAKNELLLAYLQHLVFFILLKLREARSGTNANAGLGGHDLHDSVVKELVKLRLFLEKGVRPLEDKLRYQIGKILRAADEAERHSQTPQALKVNGKSKKPETEDDFVSESEQSDSGNSTDNQAALGAQEPGQGMSSLSDLQHRPRLSAFVRPAASESTKQSTKSAASVYRPPKIAPTVMPTTERCERASRPLRSATLNEFISDELLTMPVAEPSIGATIVARGRTIKTAAERADEQRRIDYEEANLVRLPKESKKERVKKAGLDGRRPGRMQFGGEDWRDLGEGAERIAALTRGKSSGCSAKALLEKSRKRRLETVGSPRDSGWSHGVTVGEHFQKRLRVLESGRRDRGKSKK